MIRSQFPTDCMEYMFQYDTNNGNYNNTGNKSRDIKFTTNEIPTKIFDEMAPFNIQWRQ